MTTQRPDTRPPTLPLDAYGLKDAALLVDRSTKTILRWCRDNTLPNAEKIPGPKGDEWSIPAQDLAAVISDKGLSINLVDDGQTVSTQVSAQHDELVEALNNMADLRGQIGHLSGQNEQLTRSNGRLGSDNDHLRAEYERTQTQLVESERERGVLEGRLEKAEQQHAHASQERDSLDLEHRELRESTTESISVLSNDLDAARNEAATTAGERDELTSQVDVLAAKLEAAESSMGWWTRRKYER